MARQDIWGTIRSRLTPGTIIPNWTVNEGSLGDEFTIAGISMSHVDVNTPGARNSQHISRIEFETVYEIWNDYLCGSIKRNNVRNKTRFSKYIISILHWLETEDGK